MQKDFDFVDEINKVFRPKEKNSLEKALELAEQLRSKIDNIGLPLNSNKTGN
jgi:hypothetical protein